MSQRSHGGLCANYVRDFGLHLERGKWRFPLALVESHGRWLHISGREMMEPDQTVAARGQGLWLAYVFHQGPDMTPPHRKSDGVGCSGEPSASQRSLKPFSTALTSLPSLSRPRPPTGLPSHNPLHTVPPTTGPWEASSPLTSILHGFTSRQPPHPTPA